MSTPKYTDRQKRLGDDISFGVQQSIACLATDWIEAPINTRLQRMFKAEHPSTDLQNFGGELIGSIGSLFAFLGLRQVFPQLFTAAKSMVRAVGDGFYDKRGRESLRSWARSHHLSEDSPEYKEKLAQWKDFQEDSFAKASVIHVTNVAFNVAGQKTPLINNPHKWWALATTKLISGLVTPLAMLGFRLAAPRTAQRLDEELSDRYSTPLVHKMQRMFGAEETPSRPAHEKLAEDKKTYRRRYKESDSYATKLNEEEGQELFRI